MKKRILATILSICMIISLFPASAFAVESVPEVNETDEIMLLAEDEVNEVFAAANSTGSALYIVGNPSRAATVTLAYDGAPDSWTNPGYVTPGTPIKLTLTLAEGFLVDTILLNDSTEGIQKDADGTYSFEMPSGDRTVVDINFKKTERTVSVTGTSTENTADVAVTPIDADMAWDRNPNKAYFGDTVTIITNPEADEDGNPKYKIPDDGVTVTYGDNQSVNVVKSAENKYTFTMPDANVTVNVDFKQIHNITGVDKTSGKATPKTSTAIENDTVTLDVVASTGYTIKSVKYKYTDATGEQTKDATPDGTNPSIYTFIMPDADVEILAEFLGEYRKVTVNQPSDSATVGTIAVTSDSGDDTWNSTGSMMRAGSIGVVTGTPQTGYILGSVTVTRAGATPVTATKSETDPNVYTFEMPTEPVDVTASFRYPQLTITPNIPQSSPNHTTTVTVNNSTQTPGSDGKYSLAAGTQVSLSITVPENYTLTSLTVDGTEEEIPTPTPSSSNRVYTHEFTVNADCEVAFTTEKLNELTIGTVATGGTVTTNIDEDPNNSNKRLVATNADVTITASPNPGYEVDKFTVVETNDSSKTVDVKQTETTDAETGNKIYTFKMPEKDITVNVTFKAKPLTLTVEYKDITGKLMSTTDSTKEAVDYIADSTVSASKTVTPAPYAKDANGNYYILAKTDALTVKEPASGVTLSGPDSNGAYAFTMPSTNVVLTATYTKAAVEVDKDGVKTYHTTIADAVSKAKEATAGGEIQLLADCEFTSALNFNVAGTYTLDLHGHSLTSHANKKDGYGVSARGTEGNEVNLTIKDSVGGGLISNCMTNVQANNYSVVTIGEQGSTKDFRIEVNRTDAQTGSYSPLKVEELSTMKIYSGTIGAENNTGGINNRSIQSFGTTTIEGGTFEGVVQVWEWASSSTHYNSDLTINGGKFEDSVVVCTTPTKENAGEVFGGDLTINGGEFTNENAYIGLWLPDWVVDAGDLTNTGTVTDKVAPVDVKIHGGNFSLVEDHIGIIQDGGIAPNPETPVFTIGQGGTEQAPISPTFTTRPDDSYIDENLAATLTPNSSGKYTLEAGYEVSVDGYVSDEDATEQNPASNYTVTLSAGTGNSAVTKTNGLIKVPDATSVTMNIAGKPGYQVTAVKIGSTPLTADSNGVYTVTKDYAATGKAIVEVTWEAIPYAINEAEVKDADDNVIGTVKVSKVTKGGTEVKFDATAPTANAGDVVTLTVAPAIGKQLTKDSLEVAYTENGTAKKATLTQDEENVNVYTFTMPAAEVTVTAEFEDANYILKVDQVFNNQPSTTLGTVTVSLKRGNEPEEDLDLNNVKPIQKDDTLSVAVAGVADGYRVKSVNIKTTVYSNIMGQIVDVPVDRDLKLGVDERYSISMENDVLKQTTPGTPDITITVTYEKIPYTITTVATANGETANSNVTFKVYNVKDDGSEEEVMPVAPATSVTTATIGQKVKFTVTAPSADFTLKDGFPKLTYTKADGTEETKTLTLTDATSTYDVTLGKADGNVLSDLTFSVEFETKKQVTVNFTPGTAATIKIGTANAEPLTSGTQFGTTIPYDTPVTIAITPVEGSSVKAVAGTTGTLTGDNFTFNMPATDVTLNVTYMTPVTLTFDSTVGNVAADGTVGNGKVAVNFEPTGESAQPAKKEGNEYTVHTGSKVTITATPDEGYELNKLTYNGSEVTPTSTDSTTGVATYVIDTYNTATTFSVTFKAKAQPITLTAGANGKVEFSANVTETTDNGVKSYTAPTDAEVTITVTPNQGYELNGAVTVTPKDSTKTVNATSTTDEETGITTVKFTMPIGGVDVTVNFKVKTYKVNIPTPQNGTVKVTGAANLDAVTTDTALVIEPTADTGFDVDTVKIAYKATLPNGIKVDATQTIELKDGKYSFNMPGSDVTVTVTFEKVNVDPKLYEAAIGAQGYETIKKAFDAAKTGETIQLLKTVENADSLSVEGKTITLDLNGYTLTKTHQSYTISVSNGGVLTIKDSSANVSTASIARSTGGTGVVANNATDGQSTTLQAGNNGKLIIKSGTIQNGLTPNCSAIKVEELGTLVINGGTIENSLSGGVNNRSIQSFGTTTINGGTIKGVVQVWQWKENGILYPSKLTIENGTFNDSVIVCSAETANDTKYQFGGELVINGGTFNNNTTGDAMVGVRIPDWDDKLEANTQAPKMTITGGTFEVKKVGVYDNETTTYVDDSTYLVAEGGTFTATNKPIFNDIAEGMVAVEEDGKYVIKEAVAQIVKNNEDKTTVNYATINQAFDAVANGDTIKLLNDTTAEDQLTVTSMTVTLDLNGHTLTKTHSKYTVSVGGDKGDLTIIDSEGTGAIANGADNTSTTLQANNGGKLTIKGGTIKNGLQPKCSAIKVEELGTLVIEGGIIKKSSMPGVNARSIQTFGNTTINGGTIEGVVQVWQWDDAKNDPDTYYPSSLTVNGGTFGDGVVICGSTSNEAKYPFGGTVIINDGIFNDNSENEDGTMVGVRIPSWFDTTTTETTAHMTINGGTFNVEKKVGVYQADKLVENSDYLVVDGGSFKQEPNDVADGKIAVEEDGKWVIKDQTATPHKITVTEPINGTVSVIPETATAKSTVTIVAMANEGYEIDTVTVTDADDTIVETAPVEGKTGMYTFTMPDKDVTVTVTFKAKTVEKADVAQIGETKYKTVAEAVKAANDNDKIVMLADSMETEQVTVEGKTITLDLNGHTITKQHQKYTVSVGDKGDLTIIDSEGNGVIANGADNTSTTLQANNGGKLTINGGTIKNGLQPQCSAIKVEELGELVINGGIIKKSSMPGVNARSIQTFGKSTITGGTIEGVVQVWQYNTGTTPEEAYESTLNITGGTFQDSVIICGSTKPTLDYPFGGTVNITGGTFTGVNNEDGNPMVGVRLPSKLVEEGAINNHPTMNIKGGTFDVRTGVYDVAAKDYLAEDSDYLTVTNGSFSTKPDNVPDGWEVVPDGNNGWTIKEKDPDKPEPTKYNITKTDGISGGTIETNLTEAAEGEFVAVTATPDEGYKLTELYYTTPDLVDHDVIGIAAFSMPRGDIFVSAKFEKIDYSIVIVSTEDATVTVDPADKTTATIGDTVTVKVTDVAETKTVTGITVKDTNGNAIESDGEDGTYTFTMPASHVVVTANVVDKTVDPDPVFTITAPETVEGGTITVLPGKTEIKEGTLVAVIATPADGYELSEITCTDADGKAVTVTENTFTMPASNVTVTVTFKAIEEPTEPEYAIFVVNPEGVTLTAPATAAEDDTVTVETKVSAGYTLEKVFVTKADKSTFDATPGEAGEYTFPMSDGPVVVSAVVVKDDDPAPTLYNITEGTVTGGELIFVPEQAAAEATVTVIAIPDETHTYDVTVTVTDKDGTSVTVTADESTDGKYTFTMPASDVTVSATFKAIPDDTYSVKVLNVTNGTVKVNDKSELMGLEAGAEVTVTATPTEGYELDEITVIDVSAGKTVSVTDGKFTMPAGNVVVSATFKLKATEPDDPTGKVAVEAGTPDASGNVNITISNVKSDKFYTVRVANSEGMDKESVIFVLSGKMADPDTHTLTFQVKAGNKFIMVAETAEQPILGKDNPFADEKAVVVETTISDTKAN